MLETAVDLFAGCGGSSTGAEQAGLQVLCAANHWPVAVDVHRKNHPDTEHLCQDLQQANFLKWPEHDVLLASPCCIPGDGLIVTTTSGLKRAEEITVGEKVLTGSGNSKAVVNIWTKLYSGLMCKLNIWGDTKHEIKVTSDHKVLVSKKLNGKLQTPKFIRADEIITGDYVAFPRTVSKLNTGKNFVESLQPARITYQLPDVNISKSRWSTASYMRPAHESNLPGSKVTLDGSSKDLWWLIGHYLGDGQARTNRPQLGWSVGGSKENLEKVRTILKGIGLKSWTSGEKWNTTIYTSSKHLYAVCVAFGRLCHEKTIPAEVFGIEPEFIEAMIEGYIAADGCDRNLINPSVRISSVSLKLLQDVQQLCWQLGWSASIALAAKRRVAVIEGRVVRCRNGYEVIVHRHPHKQSRTKFSETHVWRSVKSIELSEVVNTTVYDFEVEDDHTFCLPGVVVHNCQGHSQASGLKNAPKHDDSRATAWAVVAAVEAKKPKALVVENVKDFMNWSLFPEWARCLTKLGYSLSKNLLDAADFGVPQKRERLFIVGVRSDIRPTPVYIPKGRTPHVAARTVIDPNAEGWSSIYDKVPATQSRWRDGRAVHGESFLLAYFGKEKGGRSLDAPFGTFLTKDRYAVVRGDQMRMLRVNEYLVGQGFSREYMLSGRHKDDVKLVGNSVVPKVMKHIISVLKGALS